MSTTKQSNQSNQSMPFDFGPIFRFVEQPMAYLREHCAEADQILDILPLSSSMRLPLAVDVFEVSDKIVVHAELPGVQKKDIKISIKNGNQLCIVAERFKTLGQPDKKGNDVIEKDSPFSNYFASEIVYGKVNRNVVLPKNCNVQKIKTSFENGILALTFDKLVSSEIRVNIE